MKISVTVGGRQYHSEQLRQITGIDVAENQARTILSDLAYHEIKFGLNSDTGKAVGATDGDTITIEVAGASNDSAAGRIARSIANSPLVKTAVAGEDASAGGRERVADGKAAPFHVDLPRIDLHS